MQYITAIGFVELAKYEPSDLARYDGRRVFVHPEHSTRITFDKNLDVYFYGNDKNDFNDVNMKLAHGVLGENAYYLAPFAEFNIKLNVYLHKKYIRIDMHESDRIRLVVKIEYDGDTARYFNDYGGPIINDDKSAPATPENIITCLRAVKVYDDFFARYDARVFRERCEKLTKENELLKEQIKFMPGGPGFDDAKKRFESTVEEQSAKRRCLELCQSIEAVDLE
jgi:hypothetical protein